MFQNIITCALKLSLKKALRHIYGVRSIYNIVNVCMDNIQHIADAVQKGLQLIVRASIQQGSTRLRRLGIELCSDSFNAVLALSSGRA